MCWQDQMRVIHWDHVLHFAFFLDTGIICPNLNAPTNGQVYVSGNTPSFNATYACNSGYVLEGLQTRTCLSDGQWSGQAPICSGMQLATEMTNAM